jgi:hypothetical protein
MYLRRYLLPPIYQKKLPTDGAGKIRTREAGTKPTELGMKLLAEEMKDTGDLLLKRM